MNEQQSPEHKGFAGRLAAAFVESKLTLIGIVASLLPGAGAKEVEQRLSIPMEKLLYELPGVEYIYSTSMPGQSMLVVRFYVGQDLESSIFEVSETKLIGGTRRQVRVLFDPLELAARNLAPFDLINHLTQANRRSFSGATQANNREMLIQTGTFLESAEDIGNIVIGVYSGNPVYLHQVAKIVDGPQEPDSYVLFGSKDRHDPESAVTLSMAKRPGANAVDVVKKVLTRVDQLKGSLIPGDVEVTVTRDYGETAAEKSNELLLHMGIAVFGVALLILIFLGWRESLIVMLAIPSTLSLTLLLFYLHGYTLNRITLFALIFSIGILVDDAIVVVENIVRHMRLPENRSRSFKDIAIIAVSEVGNPTVLATWAVIAAILPMAFVGGLMGPYMRPIPVGASAAMVFSLIIAFTITPWAATHILKRKQAAAPGDTGVIEKGHDPGHAPDDPSCQAGISAEAWTM